jgi:hypothetical protein
MPLFFFSFSFIFFRTIHTEQGRSHHTQLLDEAWAGGRYEANQWFSRDNITKLWVAWLVFKHGTGGLKVTVSSGNFWPSSPAGTRTCDPHIRGSNRAVSEW